MRFLPVVLGISNDSTYFDTSSTLLLKIRNMLRQLLFVLSPPTSIQLLCLTFIALDVVFLFASSSASRPFASALPPFWSVVFFLPIANNAAPNNASRGWHKFSKSDIMIVSFVPSQFVVVVHTLLFLGCFPLCFLLGLDLLPLRTKANGMIV